MDAARVLPEAQSEVVKAPWGSLTWYANARLGNSTDLTVGKCVIKPGCENPLHSHPNCTEILVVMQGRIRHASGPAEEVELHEGDVITVPPHLPHQARNVGSNDAVLFIVFSSADRQTKGE
jgi:quercetin dioxygenase-like cupin family protein